MVSQNSLTLWLEKSNGAAILVDVDVEGRRGGAVAGHRLHVPEERHEPARARVLADVPDGDGEAGRRVQERRVVRQMTAVGFAIIPVIILFIFGSKTFIEGLTAGAVKG